MKRHMWIVVRRKRRMICRKCGLAWPDQWTPSCPCWKMPLPKRKEK